jgi:hypothetical protein
LYRYAEMSGTDVGELHFNYYPAEPIPEAGAAAGAAAMET